MDSLLSESRCGGIRRCQALVQDESSALVFLGDRHVSYMLRLFRSLILQYLPCSLTSRRTSITATGPQVKGEQDKAGSVSQPAWCSVFGCCQVVSGSLSLLQLSDKTAMLFARWLDEKLDDPTAMSYVSHPDLCRGI